MYEGKEYASQNMHADPAGKMNKCQDCHEKHPPFGTPKKYDLHEPNVVENRACSICHQEHLGPGPMKRVARMLRKHEGLILNWFVAKGEISSGAVEGLNNKIRVVTRRSYGFRTYKAMELALYHTLGKLPEPETTHRFC